MLYLVLSNCTDRLGVQMKTMLKKNRKNYLKFSSVWVFPPICLFIKCSPLPREKYECS